MIEVFKIKTGMEKLSRERFTGSSNVTVRGYKLKGAGSKFRKKDKE